MYKVVLLQLMSMVFVAIISGIWLGERGAISAVLGGLAYLLPNLLFAVKLAATAITGRAGAATFFVGELLKLVLTVLFLAAAQKYYEVHWLTMLIALFVTLKANLFAFLLKV